MGCGSHQGRCGTGRPRAAADPRPSRPVRGAGGHCRLPRFGPGLCRDQLGRGDLLVRRAARPGRVTRGPAQPGRGGGRTRRSRAGAGPGGRDRRTDQVPVVARDPGGTAAAAGPARRGPRGLRAGTRPRHERAPGRAPARPHVRAAPAVTGYPRAGVPVPLSAGARLDLAVIGAIYRGSVAGFQRDEVPRRRFPALDPEPPPPPWWRRLLVPACVLAAVAVVVTAVRLLPPLVAGSPASRSPGAARPGHHPAGPAVRATGRVVLVTGSGSLALANPDGSHLARPGGLGNVGDAVAASPGNRYISLLNGQVISISAGPRLASFPGKIQLSSNTTVTLPDPFADHGRAVVMLHDYGDPTFSSSNPISVISIA